MHDYQRQFIEFALQQKALRFGEYTLKSGRVSPYFFNFGQFNSGLVLAELARYYAQALIASGIEFDVLFGPAYKGIPLVAATAIALSELTQRDIPYCFNRKVAKDHGEGGLFVGAPLKGRVLVVDDVITAGTTFRNMVQLFADQPVQMVGVLTALDRGERANGDVTATQELHNEFNIPFQSIAHIDHVIQYVSEQPNMASELARMRDYRTEYGPATV